MLNTDRLGLLGRTIDGRYTINAVIGEGGVGAVYRAEHSRLGRTVAIKVLHHEFSRDPEALQRFFTEARAAATLGHMNIAESIDMGELADGVPYLVLEFLDGRSLADAIRYAGRLTVRRMLRIARQIACGLEIAHDNDIIHRDLKSENVFLTHRDDNPEHVKILDFGVARVLGRANAPTKPGYLVGTPDFMAPEQIADPDHVDHRADIYATGVIMHHMLTGRLPHGEAVPISTLLYRILHEAPEPLPDEFPLEVRQLVADAMAYDRDRRIGSMGELRDRIDELMMSGMARASTRIPTIASFPIGTRPKVPAPPPLMRAQPRTVTQPEAPRSRRAWLIAGVALSVCAGVAVVAAFSDGRTAPPPAQRSAAPEAPVAAPRILAEPAATQPASPTTAVAPAAAARHAPASPPPATELQPEPASAEPATTEPARPVAKSAAVMRKLPVPSRPAPVAAHPPARRPEIAAPTAAAPVAAPPPTQPAPTAAPALPANDCNPPYYFQGNKKIFKPSCL